VEAIVTALALDGLVATMTARLPEILEDIARLVSCESPSSDLAAVAASADVVASVGGRLLGAEPERLTLDGRVHLRWRTGTGQPNVMLLGHHDTVWPVGSLQRHPFTLSGGLLRGPGCFDMKAGLVMALHAVAALGVPGGLTILVTGDEEVGSPSSRELIENEAAGCLAALVLEAAADGGAIKTERKGTSMYHVRVGGKAAHAGLEPEKGVNATVELAHQVLAVSALADAGLGTTVTPTAAAAGTTVNTVPAGGEFAVDVRMWDVQEQQRVDGAIRSLLPVIPGSALEVDGGPNRPPLPAVASDALFERASLLAGRLGLPPLARAAVGGASDGNFTAGVGTLTLDGLGAVGGGAHADHEHVLVDQIPGRTALLAALIDDLLADGQAGQPGQAA
jgi:glutamate carboxypeptidase